MYTGFWWEDLMETDHLKDQDIEGKIILKWMFKKWDGEKWSGSSWVRTETGGKHCECDNDQ